MRALAVAAEAFVILAVLGCGLVAVGLLVGRFAAWFGNAIGLW